MAKANKKPQSNELERSTAGRIDYAAIDLLVLDVDGVLTDGGITLGSDGDEIKSFNARDGAGMKYWKRLGKKLAIISGRGSAAVIRRAKELDVDIVRLNVKNKLPVFEDILAELSVSAQCAAVVGDDLTDIPVMLECGYAVAVADAVEEVRQVAVHITDRPGGAGAVREVIELILKGSGLWERILERYLPVIGEPHK